MSNNILARLLPLLLIAVCIAGCENRNGNTLEVTGQIESEAVTAGSRLGGRVAEVLVHEGDRVEAGAVLIRLDADEAEAAAAGARAQLKQAEAMLAKLRAGATVEQLAQAEAALAAAEEQYQLAQEGARGEEKRAAQAAVDAARAGAQNARSEFERAQRLLDQEVISRQMFEKADAAYKAAEAQLRTAQEQSNALASGAREEEIAIAEAQRDRAAAVLEEVRAGARIEDLSAAEGAMEAAAANVSRAEVALREMTVTAPISGMVESLDVHPGDLLKPGASVRIVNPDDLELTVYVSAAMLGFLQIGNTIPLTTDAHGDKTFEGRITYIASEGEYTPRNLQTEEERVQQVFAVQIDLDSADGMLRPGMTAIAHLPKSVAGG